MDVLEVGVLSQVIVTEDALKKKREDSAKQEHKIDREGQFARWKRSDITGKDPVESLVGYATVPILGLWGILGGIMTLMLAALEYAFKGLGRIEIGRAHV